MKQHPNRLVSSIRWAIVLVLAATSFAVTPFVVADTLDDVLGVRANTTDEGRKSQAKIDELAEETADLLTQYKQVMKIVDGLKIYNRQQERLISKQREEIGELDQSIDNVTIIERQIGPLLEEMVDNLDKFISLDVPFLIEERTERIEFLREMMDRADVAVSEKFSQVLQAYQIENGFGSNIEAYTDVIDLDGKSRQVDMLKFGRVVLVFQTPDGEVTGVWDNKRRDWIILGDEYRAEIRDGLRMARKTKTPDLVRLPVLAPGE